jgi:hypothetical protein
VVLNRQLRKRFHGRRPRRGNLWLAGVWVALALQVHIFLVLQLHNHQATLSSIAQSQSNSANAGPSLYAVNLLCPACQIARHGIVHPPSENLAGAALAQIQRAQALLPARTSLVPFLKLSGRDPPHC